MSEFALIAPVFFVVVVAALDAGLLLLSANSASNAANDAAIVLSTEGTLSSADADAITAIRKDGTALGTVDEIDIYAINATTRQPINDSQHFNVYNLDGSCRTTCNWAPSSRSSSLGANGAALTSMGITVKYHYSYLGFRSTSLNLTADKLFRLEPVSG